MREAVTNSIRYWEPRRILYNASLAAIVLLYFFLATPASRQAVLNLNGILFLFLLAVLANVAYCAAYVVDVFAQMSGFQSVWLKYRWVLLLTGIAFAGTITRFFAIALFAIS